MPCSPKTGASPAGSSWNACKVQQGPDQESWSWVWSPAAAKQWNRAWSGSTPPLTQVGGRVPLQKQPQWSFVSLPPPAGIKRSRPSQAASAFRSRSHTAREGGTGSAFHPPHRINRASAGALAVSEAQNNPEQQCKGSANDTVILTKDYESRTEHQAKQGGCLTK